MPVDIAALNTQLSTVSYLGGCYPSQKDATTFEEVKTVALTNVPHVIRWFNHMWSFTPAERAKWPKDEVEEVKEEKKEEKEEEEDEDFDVWGEEDSEEERKREEEFDRRAKQAQANIDAKKAKSGKVDIAKSMCIMDIKPFDDEVNLDEVAAKVLAIEKDGLTWGKYKLVDLAFGVKKIVMPFVIEDEKVPYTDDITDQISEFDGVQSADVVSINKM